MALLELKDIGKIYVSEGNVAVGIRGVNLSFDKGEFVAITGKSGSGKSTLLNVISGMDTYEEGELYIEGQTTSHYLQPEWEQYRQKYISFIFQDYNIIESFTVLQNVELALMHIDDRRARRAKALELLDRVGLGDRINQKGSKLSGGQKQRTVIARALAKDSPIILADEPTGNLDSKTSEEIIELLREVSRDKLLIIVTHNFDQVEHVATRHVRVFDGAIESDHVITPPAVVDKAESAESQEAEQSVVAASESTEKKGEKRRMLKNGLTLGATVFTAKPKLSAFMCIMLIIGTLAIFAVTSFFGSGMELFEKDYMFRHIDGRVVLASPSGAVIADEEAEKIVADYGADDWLRYDVLLDKGTDNYVYIEKADRYVAFCMSYGDTFGDGIIGKYPEKRDEVFLYLPIYLQKYFGKKEIKTDTITLSGLTLKVSGIKYFYDNTKTPVMLFTRDGFRMATYMHYVVSRSGGITSATVYGYTDNEYGEQNIYSSSIYELVPTYDLEDGKVYIADSEYTKSKLQYSDLRTEIYFSAHYESYNYYDDYKPSQSYEFTMTLGSDAVSSVAPPGAQNSSDYKNEGRMYVSMSLIEKIAEGMLGKSYRQLSLFFDDDREAHAVAEKLHDAGYIAVPSDATYKPDPLMTILSTLGNVIMIIMWLAAVTFLAFVINLCTGRSMNAYKSDMAIMRSMGIPVKVVRVGIYVRMFISLIPAYIFMAAASLTVFLTPALNGFFTFLHAWQYVFIGLGMLLLTWQVTHRQIGKLFRESVKKSLKGGAAA